MTVFPNTAFFSLNPVFGPPLVYSYWEAAPQQPGRVFQLHPIVQREKQPHRSNLQPGFKYTAFKNTISFHSFFFSFK